MRGRRLRGKFHLKGSRRSTPRPTSGIVMVTTAEADRFAGYVRIYLLADSYRARMNGPFSCQ